MHAWWRGEPAHAAACLVLSRGVFGNLAARAQAGGTQGIMLAGGGSAPQNQRPRLPMIQTTVTISNKLGLHARASAKLTKLAGSFPAKSGSRAASAASTPKASWA
jgi:hypothetical protein